MNILNKIKKYIGKLFTQELGLIYVPQKFRDIIKEYQVQDTVYTANPIYVVQSLEHGGLLDGEYHDGEESGGDFTCREEIFSWGDCESYTLERFKEILADECRYVLSDTFKIDNADFEDYKKAYEAHIAKYLAAEKKAKEEDDYTDLDEIEEIDEDTVKHYECLRDLQDTYSSDGLIDIAEKIHSSDNFTAGIYRYNYVDKTWFLTKKAAEEHIKARSYRYKKPRVYVKSFYDSWEFKYFLKCLGMERR